MGNREHLAIAVCAALLTSVPAAGQSTATEPETELEYARTAFDHIRSLLGVWRIAGREDNGFEIVFEAAAGGTVIRESWMLNGVERSFSVYHLDGTDVIATHYCPLGNQPRLALISGGEGKPVRFAFKDVTNLPSLRSSHLRTLEFALSGDQQELLRSEMYLNAGREDASSLMLRRYSE